MLEDLTSSHFDSLTLLQSALLPTQLCSLLVKADLLGLIVFGILLMKRVFSDSFCRTMHEY